MSNEDETAASSDNAQAEHSNDRPKRTKKPILRLAPHASHVRSEEAEDNENIEWHNEAMGR